MKKILFWLLRLVPAIILLQTLFFKFTAHPDSVALFSTLGLEPYGRLGIGIAELITAILILIPRTTFYGAVSGLLLMLGAIFSHLTKLGIETNGDGGMLFVLAIVTALFCLILAMRNLPKKLFSE